MDGWMDEWMMDGLRDGWTGEWVAKRMVGGWMIGQEDEG